MREDYGDDGDAWSRFPHEQAVARAYRWGEDGLAGISDSRQLICFALALWNGKDKPPETNGDGKNNRRVIRSRSGHIIRFDDSDGAELIEVIDKTEKNKIVIDSSANTITLEADSDIKLESKNGDVIIKGQNLKMDSTSQNVEVKAKANMDLKAGPQVNIKGTVVNIN